MKKKGVLAGVKVKPVNSQCPKCNTIHVGVRLPASCESCGLNGCRVELVKVPVDLDDTVEAYAKGTPIDASWIDSPYPHSKDTCIDFSEGNCLKPALEGSRYCPKHLDVKYGSLPASRFYFEKKPDAVNHPKHYNSGRFEVAEVIEDWKLDFRTGNALKYIARAGKKDPLKYVEDLEKAIWYLKRAIYVYRAEHEGIDRVKPDEMK